MEKLCICGVVPLHSDCCAEPENFVSDDTRAGEYVSDWQSGQCDFNCCNVCNTKGLDGSHWAFFAAGCISAGASAGCTYDSCCRYWQCIVCSSGLAILAATYRLAGSIFEGGILIYWYLARRFDAWSAGCIGGIAFFYDGLAADHYGLSGYLYSTVAAATDSAVKSI